MPPLAQTFPHTPYALCPGETQSGTNQDCFPTILQHFVVKNCFYFKTPDGAGGVSSLSYYCKMIQCSILNSIRTFPTYILGKWYVFLC